MNIAPDPYNACLITLRSGLDKNAKAKQVSMIYKTNNELKSINLEDERANEIVDLFISAFFNKNILKTEKGKKFLVGIFHKIFFKLDAICNDFQGKLRQCRQEDAEAVGEILINVWFNLDSNEKSRFEIGLLKPIIDWAIRAETPAFHKNCCAVLKQFRAKRRRKELMTSLVMMYEPIIFRYLHAANPFVRENTLQLFIGVAFPLESSQFSQTRNVELRTQQVDELKLCMKDPSPSIRATAAKGVCRALYEFWQFFQPNHRHEFILSICSELCFDAAASGVRIAALEGLSKLSDLNDAIPYILDQLPTIAYLLHDPKDKVRLTFLRLLDALSQFKDANIFNSIHLDHILYRLVVDGDDVAAQICSLLHSSFFPESDEKPKKVNAVRISRCLFLLHRNLEAATAFYQVLPQYVSVDEVLVFLRSLFYWSEQVSKGGKVPKLPATRIRSPETAVLKEFESVEDLEIPEHQAVWVVISAAVTTIADLVKSKDRMREIRSAAFEELDARRLVGELPDSVLPHFYRFLNAFEPTEDEVGIALEYLSDGSGEAWGDALKCLFSWNVLDDFFEKQSSVIPEMLSSECELNAEERSAKMGQAIKYLIFIWTNSKIRGHLVDERFFPAVTRILQALAEMLPMLFLKLGIDFPEKSKIDSEVALAVSEDCYIRALELMIALRLYLSIKELNDNGDRDGFYGEISRLSSEVFMPTMRGIVSHFGPGLEAESFQYRVLECVMKLVADMVALHIIDHEDFKENVEFLGELTAAESGGISDALRHLIFVCQSKIAVNLAIDGGKTDGVFVAEEILKLMASNAGENQECIEATATLILSLGRTQKKKLCIPWLHSTLLEIAEKEEIAQKIIEAAEKTATLIAPIE